MRFTALRVTVLLLMAAVCAAQENSFSFDLHSFSQKDRGGNPFQAEGFEYYGGGSALQLQLNEEVRLNLQATVAYIDNSLPQIQPASVVNGNTTSASTDLTTLDSLASLEIRQKGSPWIFKPGIYYHHQIDSIGPGVDLGVAREFDEGNTELQFNYSFRWDYLSLLYWDGSDRGFDDRLSHNFLFGWTQIVNPSLKTHLGFQHTRQDGFLSETYNYVTLHTGAIPTLLIDEVLPDQRHRSQVNGRLRYSWDTGHSVGLDGSFYWDDWDIRHYALQPSLDTMLFGKVRWSLWYRLSVQERSKYWQAQPQAAGSFLTQDSDLDSFTMHSPGTTLLIPLGKEGKVNWDLRLTGYGFFRDDSVDGLGANVGVVLKW